MKQYIIIGILVIMLYVGVGISFSLPPFDFPPPSIPALSEGITMEK